MIAHALIAKYKNDRELKSALGGVSPQQSGLYYIMVNA